MAEPKKYPNKLGIVGWLSKGKWGYERYLYSLHRITGLGILFYFLMHIFVTSARVFGKEAWGNAMASVSNPIFKLGEFAVFAAFAFHALNGIRLILIELGFAVGKAEEPVFPYQSSVDVQRKLSITVMVLAFIVVVIGGIRYLKLFWGGM